MGEDEGTHRTDTAEPDADGDGESPPSGRRSGVHTWVAVAGGIVLVVLGFVIGRATADDDDAAGVATGEDQPSAQVSFPAGDASRENYWALVGLRRLVADTFDRESDPTSLGQTGTGDDWVAHAGRWGIEAGRARLVVADPGGLPNLAVVPVGSGDGLMEVTMSVVEDGAGLVFRHRDADNHWTVTANRSLGSWSVNRTVDGETELVGEVVGPTADNTTITITQNGPLLRFLVDGVERLSLTDRALAGSLEAGLVAAPASTGEARWDRFLTMVVPQRADAAGGGTSSDESPASTDGG